MVEFKQFYTGEHISEQLTSLISYDRPLSCLELSAGEGALVDSVLEKYPDINITAIDIDVKNYEKLQKKYPTHNVYCCDSTSTELEKVLGDSFFDIAVCNPPFISISNCEHYRRVIKEILFEDITTKKIRAEIVFFCLNLKSVRDDGELVIILPELFFVSEYYVWFRKAVSEFYNVKTIVECKHKSFEKTEAKTHIYHLVKSKNKDNGKINFIKNNDNFSLDYQDFIGKKNIHSDSKYDDFFTLFRGNTSGKQCKLSGVSYFHSSSFKRSLDYKDFHETLNGRVAVKNDILIARVGTRVLGETEVFNGEKAIISDCIFCLRIHDSKIREYFLEHWLNDRENWINSNSNGTCAKHFSLYSFREYVRKVVREYFI